MVVAVVCRGQGFHIPMDTSFDRISPVLDCIESKFLEAYLANRFDVSDDFRAAYLQYLSYAGWTEREFNEELLQRVDAGW